MDGYDEVDDLIAGILGDKAYRRPQTRRERIGRFLMGSFDNSETHIPVKSFERIGTTALVTGALLFNQLVEVKTGVNPLGVVIDTLN